MKVAPADSSTPRCVLVCSPVSTMAASAAARLCVTALVVVGALGAARAASAADKGARRAAAATSVVGINLGNVLEEAVERPAPHDAEERFFDAYKAAGFGLVRVPVRWDNHTLRAAPYTVDPVFLARVAEVAGWATSRGLRAIVNSHHDDWLDVADDAAFNASLPRFVAIWQQVADHFAGASPLLAFEVFNEPHLMSLASLNAMQAAVHAVVRVQHPTRTLIICGLAFEGPWWLLSPAAQGLALPTLAGGADDPALTLEVHDYDPFGFASPPFSIFSWGTAADVKKAHDALANVTAWALARRPPPAPPLPVILGEFAVSSLQTNSTARLMWFSVMAQAARDAGFDAFAIWDDGGWFTTLDRVSATWDTAVLTAIGA
jgi:endoglucanase